MAWGLHELLRGRNKRRTRWRHFELIVRCSISQQEVHYKPCAQGTITIARNLSCTFRSCSTPSGAAFSRAHSWRAAAPWRPGPAALVAPVSGQAAARPGKPTYHYLPATADTDGNHAIIKKNLFGGARCEVSESLPEACTREGGRGGRRSYRHRRCTQSHCSGCSRTQPSTTSLIACMVACTSMRPSASRTALTSETSHRNRLSGSRIIRVP